MSRPLNSLHDRPEGKLPPALLQFNRALHQKRIVPCVRAWVSTALGVGSINYRIADRIISEARVRIVQFHDTPLDALALSAVLNTIVYRDNSVDFTPLVEQAKEAFASSL